MMRMSVREPGKLPSRIIFPIPFTATRRPEPFEVALDENQLRGYKILMEYFSMDIPIWLSYIEILVDF
jgi:hypothetical protein